MSSSPCHHSLELSIYRFLDLLSTDMVCLHFEMVTEFKELIIFFCLIRRHRFYTMNLVMPCAMLSTLTLVTFLSPPDQGEKISLGISILLSFSVFMLTLSENMPKTSESLPLFGMYSGAAKIWGRNFRYLSIDR